jgi:signal transduction histidine kinase
MTADAAVDRASASNFTTAGFSAAQLEDSVAAADKQAAWLAWMTSTTGETRDFARRQVLLVQAAYVVAVAAIAAAELAQPKLPSWLLTAWLLESIANLALRMALFSRMFVLQGPADLARSPARRLIPLVCNLIVGCHWIWTSTLFIGAELDATTVAVIVAYLLMSVAAISISPASPITAVIYPAFLWVPFALCSAKSGWAPPALLVVLMVVVALTLVMTYITVTTHIRKYILKSDKAELLLMWLRESNERLSQANTELQVQRREAQHELEARSEYFTSASHDLRQRLHALNLLTTTVADGSPVRQDAFAYQRLRPAIEDLETYLHDILEFAKCEHMVQEPTMAPVHLQDVFQDLNLQFEDVAESRGVDLRFRATTIELVTDRRMLTRILENLISNAIKFNRPAGAVLVAGRRRGGQVSVEVWDQGRGIPAAAQGDVFRSFHQLPYYSRRVEGVGLGLAIVERLVHCLGYTREMRSVEGRGSVMKVLIPIGPGETKEHSHE